MEWKRPALINLYRVKGLPEGFSDLLFFGFDGRPAFIEVKKPKQKQKPEQIHFMELMRSRGYRAGVAHSVEEALEIIGSAGLNQSVK